MLVYFLISAILLAGLLNAPWWFWLVGAAGLAFLSLTDPHELRLHAAGAGRSAALLPGSLLGVSAGCLASAATFAAGRALLWALPL